MALTLDLPVPNDLVNPSPSRKAGERQYSYRSIEEICNQLGLPADDVAAKRPIQCPHCGAKKFRVSKPETGRCGCDACDQAHKDYTALWAVVKNSDLRAACKATRIYGEVASQGFPSGPSKGFSSPKQSPESRPAKVASPPRLTKLKPASDMAINLCCHFNGKKGIAEAFKAFGALEGEFRASPKSPPQPVIAIPFYDSGTLAGVINYQIHGVHGLIKAREKNDDGIWVTAECKTYTAEKGTPDCVAMSTGDRLDAIAGKPIPGLVLLKTEGPPDCMAAYLMSRKSERRVIPFTNLYGCRTLHTAPALLPLLEKLKPELCLCCHDCDTAGQESAIREFPDVGWSNLLRDICDDSRNVVLPCEILPKKGRDLRDWIAEGGDWPAFQLLIEGAQRVAPPTAPIDLERIANSTIGPPGNATGEETDGAQGESGEGELAGEGEGNSDVMDNTGGLSLISVGRLTIDYVQMRREIISGLLRVGEVMTVIASPKLGKSWLVLLLAWCVATGRNWLGFAAIQGRVLIIDNELHPETISARLWKVSRAMGIEIEDADERIDLLSLRGNLCDIDALSTTLTGMIEPGKYKLIILDALYRMLPAGISENDNAGMTQVFNTLDRISSNLECGVVVVHHTSKGDQGGKSITDTGAGAGSVARAADTHLIIRPHVDAEHVVLEAVTRSFVAPDPISIRFDWPLWSRSDLPPDVRRDTARDIDQRKKDAEVDERIVATLKESGELSVSELRSRTGFGDARLARSLTRLTEAKKINREKSFSQRSGREADRYSLAIGDDQPDGS
jgi:hypothetical protein